MLRPRKIITGLNAWLNFERMCKRDPLFSESYLAFPIGQLLAPRYGAALRSEYPHPVMAPLKTGRGDKPRIDFVALDDNQNIVLAIETKWLSTSPTLHRDIIRDLVRLELVAHLYKCEAWLILAGLRKDLRILAGDSKFQGHPDHADSKPILPYGNRAQGGLRLNPAAKFRKDLLQKALIPFKGMEIAECIYTQRFGPYPAEGNRNDLVACLWRIRHESDIQRFFPENTYEFTKA